MCNKCDKSKCECEKKESENRFNKEETKQSLQEFHHDLVKDLGGIENAMKWIELMDFIKYEKYDVDPNFCYVSDVMDEEPETMYPYILEDMIKIGIKFPKKFPKELDFNYWEHDKVDDLDTEEEPEVYACEIIEENEIGKFLYEFFETYGQVNAFRVAYIDPIINELQDIDEQKYDDLFDDFNTLDNDLIALSFDKMKLDKEFAPDKSGYIPESIMQLRNKIYMFKKLAYRYRICLGTELSDLFVFTALDLDGEAEKEAFGLNSYGRAHPDFYINGLMTMMIELGGRIKDLEDKIEDMKRYHNGSIASLESLKGMLLSLNKKSIKVRELVDEIIPGCIEIVKEERENLRKEIENKTYNEKNI